MGQQIEQQIEQQREVLHIEARKIVAFGLERHIERGHTEISEEIVEKDSVKILVQSLIDEQFIPDNADEERTGLNIELIPRPTIKLNSGEEARMKISQVIRKRIKEATGLETVPADRNEVLEVLLSGSPETMCAMPEETLASWCKDSVQWCKDTFGEENVVSATLHRDEKTPHIHVFVVPIVSGLSKSARKRREKRKARCEKTGEEYREYNVKDKLRLCADDLMGSEAYSHYHDTYSQVTIKYGLHRGVKAEKGSKKRHQTSEDYNRELAKQREQLDAQIRSQKEQIEQLKSDLAFAKADLNSAKSLNNELSSRNTELIRENEILHNLVQEQEGEYYDKIDIMAGIPTQQTLLDMTAMTNKFLKDIVRDDLDAELQDFSRTEKGNYLLNVTREGNPFVFLIQTGTGKVFYIKDNKWVQAPKLNGMQFLNFFKVVKNPVFYADLEKAIRKRISIQGKMRASSSAPSQVHRGGGSSRPSDNRKPVNLGRGGSVPTAGASSTAGKGESLYDELVRKGNEESHKNRGPRM